MTGSNPLWIFLLKFSIMVHLIVLDVEAFRHTNFTLVKIINSMKSSWEAGENPTDTPWKPDTNVEPLEEEESKLPFRSPQGPRNDHIPEEYDSLTAMKNTMCSQLMSKVRHQGECSSSWAVASASIMSDRICLISNASIQLDISGEDLLTCCEKCLTERHSCKGGSASKAFNFWAKEGVVTGGEAFSRQGCKPYSSKSRAGMHVMCQKRCTNSIFTKPYRSDKYFGVGYSLKNNVEAIQREIMINGPVLASFRLYEDFMEYKRGIYRHLHGPLREYHHIKIIGWGSEMFGKYWKAVNSFGKSWGSEGHVQILRGVNECGIEESVIGCRPKIGDFFHGRVLQAESSRGNPLQLSGGNMVLVKIVVAYMYKYFCD